MAVAEGETAGTLDPATGAQKALAAVIDVAITAVPMMLFIRRNMRAGIDSRRAVERNRTVSAIAPLKAVLEEQMGSPGVWVAGIRTVDTRTGRRVALWRTLLLASARLGLHQLVRRAPRPDPRLAGRRAEVRRETAAIAARFREGEEGARNAAMEAYFKGMPGDQMMTAGLLRPIAIGLGSVLINHFLRRRIAPTTLVSRPPRGAPQPDQSP
jgi:hypothetical protein